MIVGDDDVQKFLGKVKATYGDALIEPLLTKLDHLLEDNIEETSEETVEIPF